jgi:hypothetical protein
MRKRKIVYEDEYGEVYNEREYDLKFNYVLTDPKRRFVKRFGIPIYFRVATYYRYLDILVSNYLEYNTNRLVRYIRRDVVIPLTVLDMADVLDVSTRTVARFLGACRESGYILKDKAGSFVVNPAYYLSGRGFSIAWVSIFNEDRAFKAALARSDKGKIDEYIRYEARGIKGY